MYKTLYWDFNYQPQHGEFTGFLNHQYFQVCSLAVRGIGSYTETTGSEALDESVATAGENRQAESAEFQASWHRLLRLVGWMVRLLKISQDLL